MKAIQFKNTTYLKQFMLLILLVLIVPISVSCSEDDTVKEELKGELKEELKEESKEEPKESIIGKWQLIDITIEDEDESPEELECFKKGTIEFTSDGVCETINFDFFHNQCHPDPVISKSTWIDKGNNTIELTDADGNKSVANYLFIDGNLKLFAYDEEGYEEYFIYKKI